MIHFTIKFLICFSKPVEPVKKEPAKKRPVKQPIPSKKKGKPAETPAAADDPPVVKDENIIECSGNTRNWCHIEYCLLDEVLPKVEINIVTWGPAAKIYTKDDCRSVRTIIVGDAVWVYFVMAHKICDLSNEDAEELKNINISFSFSQNQAKMMNSMVNDWPKEYMVCKKASEMDLDKWFSELRQTNPLDETHKEVLKNRAENFKISRPEGKSIVSMIQLSPYDKKIHMKVQEVMSTLPPEIKLKDVSPKKGNKSPGKGKKEKIEVLKKGNKGKTSTEDRSKISVRAEILIANKSNICVDQTDVLPGLRYAAVLPTVTKILTEDQDITFVPLTVNIEHLEDLPLEFLKGIHLKNIFARYELANVLDMIETSKVVLSGTNADKDIDLDDTRVFFIGSLEEISRNQPLMTRPSLLNLAESLMTRNMVVKFYGEVPEPGEIVIEPCLFGHKPNDLFISTPDHEMFFSYKHPPAPSTEVFLGSASVKLIRLVKGYCSLDTTAVLTSASVSTWDPTFDMEDLIDQMENRNSRTVLLEKLTQRGVIPETLLIEHCTRITVTVSIGCQLSNLTEHQMITIPNIYQRIIVLFKDRNYADSIFEQIKKANNMFGDPYCKASVISLSFSNAKTSLYDHYNNFFPSSLVSNNRTLPSVVSQIRDVQRFASLSSNKNMTGFLIEDPEESILVLEAPPYIMPHVTDFLIRLVPLDGRVIHDSSLFFTKKIYSDFFPAHMYLVRLSTSLNRLLQNASNYLEKSPPVPALQALLLLDLMRRTRTLNSACINQLFPSCDQLISFNIAFGSTYPDSSIHKRSRSS